MKAIIVGAGPSGVSAALYLESRGVDVTLFEKKNVGGLIAGVSKVSHYTGIEERETGETFAKKLMTQISNTNIKLIFEEVLEIKKETSFIVKTDKKSYESDILIYAAGCTPKNLDVEGRELVGKVASKVTEKCDGTAVVAGGADGACKEAIYLSDYYKNVHIVEQRDGMFCVEEFKKKIEDRKNIYFHSSSTIKSANGNPSKKVVLHDSNKNEDITISDDIIDIFVYIGQTPNSDLVEHFLKLDGGFIDTEVETDVKGLYVVGDVRKKAIRQIATAVSDGCEAAIKAFNYAK